MLFVCNVSDSMTTSQFLAPQAYTKEVLKNALLWLETQPEAVRKQVETNDQAVSLFLRAKRGGSIQPSTVNSKTIEQFHSDLKSLAESMRQFEGGESSLTPPTPAVFSAPPQTTFTPSPATPVSKTPDLPRPLTEALDPKSREVLSAVCRRLNLSDPEQALRMLIVLGAEKLKVLD